MPARHLLETVAASVAAKQPPAQAAPRASPVSGAGLLVSLVRQRPWRNLPLSDDSLRSVVLRGGLRDGCKARAYAAVSKDSVPERLLTRARPEWARCPLARGGADSTEKAKSAEIFGDGAGTVSQGAITANAAPTAATGASKQCCRRLSTQLSLNRARGVTGAIASPTASSSTAHTRPTGRRTKRRPELTAQLAHQQARGLT